MHTSFIIMWDSRWLWRLQRNGELLSANGVLQFGGNKDWTEAENQEQFFIRVQERTYILQEV